MIQTIKDYIALNWKRVLLILGAVLAPKMGVPLLVLAIDDFGINFHRSVLRKFYEDAVTPAVTNNMFEGEVKAFGDRLRLLQVLHDVQISTYAAGTNMSVQPLFDTTDELVIDQQRYYNFGIDKVEELFTYGNDLADALIENSAKELQKTVDSFVLAQLAAGIAAGNWLGQNARVAGGGSETHASVATTAAGGTLSVQCPTTSLEASVEIPDGTLIYSGFTTDDLGKPVRLTSGATWATEWYRITARTDSNTVSIVNWDDSTAGYPIPNGDILRNLYGGRDFTSDVNGDDKPASGNVSRGWGWEFQAAIPSTVTSSNIFSHLTYLAEMLDKNFTPQDDRHLVVPFSVRPMLLQSTEMRPSGIEAIYTDTIVNAKVARVSGFDIHVAHQGRFSTKIGHSTSSGQGSDISLTTGTTGYCWPAIHKSFCTFAFKWSESRTIQAEAQFAKLYQGLNLYGAKVPTIKKTAGAILYSQAV